MNYYQQRLRIIVLGISFLFAASSDTNSKCIMQVKQSTLKQQHQNPFAEIPVEHMSKEDIAAEAAKVFQRSERKSEISMVSTRQDLRSDMPHTTVECQGPSKNVTCIFKNLYIEDGSIKVFMKKGEKLPETMHSLQTLHRYGGEESIEITETAPVAEHVLPGLTLMYATIWHMNIGHFLWDGLYPAYVALAQWNRTDKDFHSLASFEQNCLQAGTEDGKCLSEGIMRRFGGGEFIERNSMKGTYRLEEAIVGSGRKGARTVNCDLALWGGRDLDAIRSFRDRIYSKHGLQPPPRKSSAMDGREPGDPLRAVIIDNKRYDADEKDALMALRAEDAPVAVDYIDYADISGNFTKQLEMLQGVDIHVSGPGTGSSYAPFLTDGSVHIALGMKGTWNFPIDFQRPYPDDDVSFMEEYWYEGNTHLKALTYDVKTRRKGLKRDKVSKLIVKASELIRGDYKMPVAEGENLSPVGKTFREYCHSSGDLGKQALDLLNGDAHEPDGCQVGWPEAVVWEVDCADESTTKYTNKFPIDYKLLRDIRRKYIGPAPPHQDSA